MGFFNPNTDRDTILTLKRWLENKNKGRSFADYFRECGYRTVGIFDAGEIGRILYEELKDTGIRVEWFVDKNAEGIQWIDGIPVKLMQEVFDLPAVDIVCVSPIYDYEAVNRYLAAQDPQIRDLCNLVCWLEHGHIKMFGEVDEVCAAYERGE